MVIGFAGSFSEVSLRTWILEIVPSEFGTRASRAMDAGKSAGEKDILTRLAEFKFTPNIDRHITNATKSGLQATDGVRNTLTYLKQNVDFTGVEASISEVFFFVGVLTALNRLKSTSPQEPSTSDTPESSAQAWFAAEWDMRKGATDGLWTWWECLISDAKNILKSAEDEYKKRYWTKVFELAMAKKGDVGKRTEDSTREKNNKEWWRMFWNGTLLRNWWFNLGNAQWFVVAGILLALITGVGAWFAL